MVELLGAGRSKSGMLEGDIAEGELEIGQVSGMIGDILEAGDVIRSMVKEYRETVGRLPGI